jgi:hypothetical protein
VGQAALAFAEPAGQPIVTVGYHERIAPLQTGVPGLVLANTTQIYPRTAARTTRCASASRLRAASAREQVPAHQRTEKACSSSSCWIER